MGSEQFSPVSLMVDPFFAKATKGKELMVGVQLIAQSVRRIYDVRYVMYDIRF
ncbi:hypothetical protein [Poritiphilus flavus]|uniref:Uncharacterized protein n=1 Tax=Poritiphilus flavus TaxID=2697053 RepID=A0A6L9E918_9FLAO|nr:hypothetical protein [Poritiphilus flavus]NAS11267.1 hypothetical protein [Poritiphilus flavus]